MSDHLLELQRSALSVFKSAGPAAEVAALAAQLDSGRRSSDDGLAAYVNNVRATVIHVLGLTYAITASMMGRAHFCRAAVLYLMDRPPQSGDLSEYGEGFYLSVGQVLQGTLLDSQQIAEIARFEWLIEQLRSARSEPSLTRKQLVALPPDQWPALHMRLTARAQTFAGGRSLVNSLKKQSTADLPVGFVFHDSFAVGSEATSGVLLLAAGFEDNIHVVALSDAESAWITAINAGLNLGEATGAAIEIDADFDLLSFLLRLLDVGALHVFEQ